jgi:methionyl-tRNA formyltransferase
MPAAVFMGTPEWALPSLDALARSGLVRVAGVITQAPKPAGRSRQVRPSAVHEAALALGIPVLTPEKPGDPEGMAALDRWKPDLIVVCAYGRILPTRVLEHPPLGCWNLHFSLLPRWRGASPVQAAILAGDPVSGVSLQRMVKALDAGPLVAETEPVPIRPDDTAPTLGERLARESAKLLLSALPALLSGHPMLRGQDQERVTTCGIVHKEDGAVDWERDDAGTIHRRWRAFQPWPGCYGYLDGRRIEFTRLELDSPPESAGSSTALPGTLLPGGWVPGRQGFLRLVEVKPEGKRAMSCADFLNGNPQALGRRFLPAARGQRLDQTP